MRDLKPRKAESGTGGALARLISELGQAAQAGWGPTVRWLAFFAAVAIILVMLGY